MANINKVVRKTEIAPNVFRYRIIITSDPCAIHTHESRFFQGMFLKWLAENPTLLDCGPQIFDKLHIFHNGECWTAEAEAEVKEIP